MKLKIFVLSLFVMISVAAVNTNQWPDIEAPAAVVESMNTRYPDAKNVKWELEDDGAYEAAFKIDWHKMSATFQADGTWLETETKIKIADLPTVVREAVDLHFPLYDIEKAEKMETPELAVAYEVNLENIDDDTKIEVVLSPEGKILKQKMEVKDEETEERDRDDY